MLQARGCERGLGEVGQQIPRRGFGKVSTCCKEINTSYATIHVTSWNTILKWTALERSVFCGERARNSLYSLDSYLNSGVRSKFRKVDFDARGSPSFITLKLALKKTLRWIGKWPTEWYSISMQWNKTLYRALPWLLFQFLTELIKAKRKSDCDFPASIFAGLVPPTAFICFGFSSLQLANAINRVRIARYWIEQLYF